MLTATIEELRSRALAAGDASGYFPAIYARVTERIELAAASGRFADATRLENFARTFAGHYLKVSRDDATPRCWRATFDVAGDRRLLIVQHLLLGINAHVNHDLPQVVIELAPEPDDLARLRPDFDAVNDILAETLPIVVKSLGTVSRWVNLVASRGGGKVFDFSLNVARSRAWDAAVRLQPLEADARRAEINELDRLVAVLAYIVAHPSPPLSWSVAVARRLEERDSTIVTKKLLGHLA